MQNFTYFSGVQSYFVSTIKIIAHLSNLIKHKKKKKKKKKYPHEYSCEIIEIGVKCTIIMAYHVFFEGLNQALLLKFHMKWDTKRIMGGIKPHVATLI